MVNVLHTCAHTHAQPSEASKGHKETLGDAGCIDPFDCGEGNTSVYKCSDCIQNVSMIYVQVFFCIPILCQ